MSDTARIAELERVLVRAELMLQLVDDNFERIRPEDHPAFPIHEGVRAALAQIKELNNG